MQEPAPHRDVAVPQLADLPAGGLETPYGTLYRPLREGRQLLVLLAAFAAGPACGYLVAELLGDLSKAAQTALYVPYVLIFFAGYALWVARLNAIAFEGIGWSLIKALFNLIVRRRKPKQLHDVLPSKEKLLEMMVRAQKAGASFSPVAWLIAPPTGLMSLMFDSGVERSLRFALVTASCVLFGQVLARLGRRGWLPFMEEE